MTVLGVAKTLVQRFCEPGGSDFGDCCLFRCDTVQSGGSLFHWTWSPFALTREAAGTPETSYFQINCATSRQRGLQMFILERCSRQRECDAIQREIVVTHS